MSQTAIRTSDGLRVRADFQFLGSHHPMYDENGKRYEAWTAWIRIDAPEAPVSSFRDLKGTVHLSQRYEDYVQTLFSAFDEKDARQVLEHKIREFMAEYGYEPVGRMTDRLP